MKNLDERQTKTCKEFHAQEAFHTKNVNNSENLQLLVLHGETLDFPGGRNFEAVVVVVGLSCSSKNFHVVGEV
jgi:hypothetical protein